MCLKKEIRSITKVKRWKPILDGNGAHKALWEYSGKSLGITKHCVSNPNLSSFHLTKREKKFFLKPKTKVIYILSS